MNKYLGIPKYQWNRSEERDEVGLTTGLAYTQYGGATLECEVAVVPGKGKLVITGLLEKGMQESAQAAMSYIRAREKVLGLEEDFYQKLDFHIHFPELYPKTVLAPVLPWRRVSLARCCRPCAEKCSDDR